MVRINSMVRFVEIYDYYCSVESDSMKLQNKTSHPSNNPKKYKKKYKEKVIYGKGWPNGFSSKPLRRKDREKNWRKTNELRPPTQPNGAFPWRPVFDWDESWFGSLGVMVFVTLSFKLFVTLGKCFNGCAGTADKSARRFAKDKLPPKGKQRIYRAHQSRVGLIKSLQIIYFHALAISLSVAAMLGSGKRCAGTHVRAWLRGETDVMERKLSSQLAWSYEACYFIDQCGCIGIRWRCIYEYWNVNTPVECRRLLMRRANLA